MMDIPSDETAPFFIRATFNQKNGQSSFFDMRLKDPVFPFAVFPALPQGKLCLIFHLDKGQAMSRCRRPCLAPVSGCQDSSYFPGRTSADTDSDQRPGNDSYHMIEKTAAADPDHNAFPFPLNVQAINRPHRILYAAFRGTETLKIMLTQQKTGCLTHLFNI